MGYITVYIKLTISGISTGPFDLYSDVDNFADTFDEGVTREDLLAGYTSYLVPEGTTQIKIQSLGLCTNYIIVDVAPPATSTTTSTTSSTTSTSTTTTTTSVPLLCTVYADDCETTSCVKTAGRILINSVAAFTWASWDSLPKVTNLFPSSGDEITIEADCYAGGSGCVGITPTISISVDGSVCASAVDDDVSYTFTFSDETSIEIQPSCIAP